MSRLDKVKKMATAMGIPVANPFQVAPIVDAARNRPRLDSTVRHASKLEDAFDKRVDQIKPGASVGIERNYVTPKGDTLLDRVNAVANDPMSYASSSSPGDPVTNVNINPNMGREAYAHELGHLASQQTDIGNMVASIRANPHLKNAVLTSLLVGSGAGLQAAIEGGDEDLDTSLAVAALAAAPTMIDEGLATKNALAIMDTAGVRASLGQRGKLASGLLSYMAAPVLAATAGNIVGNQLD